MRKVAVLAVVLMGLCIGYVAPMLAGQTATLKPGISSSDVRFLTKPRPTKKLTGDQQYSFQAGSSGILDTLRAYSGIGGINFGFTDRDSMLIWFQPTAACSLKAIRFHVLNWEGNMLIDIWDGSRYDGHITSQDSTDANGWIGTYVPITSTNWVPGPVISHTPLGWNATDPEHHYWGPFPFTVTRSHANSWVEVPASYGLQGEVDLGREPFYVGAIFFQTEGWGFLCDTPEYLPYSFFKFYAQCCGPDQAHDGWFIRSYSPWVETIVSYYENTPPKITGLTVQNDTYGPGPFHIRAEITDQDAENATNSGVASAHLVYTIDTVRDSTPLDGPFEGGTFTGAIPEIAVWDTVTYCIVACDPPGLCSRSKETSFGRIEPVHKTADLLLINDGMLVDSLYRDILDYMIVDEVGNRYEYEYWDIVAHHGIDASVVNWGWRTLIIAGWGCNNTLSGWEYSPQDMYACFLDSGSSPPKTHNILYIDQDYFCVHADYGCDWDEELQEGDFLFDYFGITFAISDNHGAEVGDYDSVAVGVEGDPISADFADDPLNFRPDALTDSPGNWNWPDWIDSEISEAVQIFTYRNSQFGAGMRYDGGHFRTVYIPWQFDFAVDTTEAGSVIPRPGGPLLIQNVLHWFQTKTGSAEPSIFENPMVIPSIHTLNQNYPNPFNAATRIRYHLGTETVIELFVYNTLGQKIRTLFRGTQKAGSHSVIWNGKDETGGDVSSGIYFYQLKTDGTSQDCSGGFVKTRRMILLK